MSRNVKDIVKTDPHMRSTHSGYFKDVQWHYYPENLTVCLERGMHLICNNGCLHWPTLNFLYTQVSESLLEGFFSANLESIRKDVECTLGF